MIIRHPHGRIESDILRVPSSGVWMEHKARWELAHMRAFMRTDI